MIRFNRFLRPGRGFKPLTYLRNMSERLFESTSALDSPSLSTLDPNPLGNLSEGLEVEGFVVKQISKVPDFQLTAVRLVHLATGAQYLHVHRQDSNNAFSVGFRTTPGDSTGLPHILEHTTLCGSQLYPCRDPFFKMLNRSMATFMNAMTGPDYTMYPFSTQNPRDYNNLMSVYLDAVFRPKLDETDFRQEGWRLEHEKAEDKSSPIVLKGVVFNEMKGAFSENQTLFGQQLLNSILPGHTYSHVSGGDPLVIPSLTYQDLKAFHRHYYNPSNARFYSYGNFPLEKHLKYINEYLCDSEFTPEAGKRTAVPLEQRWSSERRKHISCRVDSMAADPLKQSSLAVAYLCSDINDVEETFVLQVLSELLVKGPNSALYKSLVEPNIGAGFSPVTGYDAQTRDTIFTVGLQGLAEKDFENVIQIIGETFQRVVETGFEKQHVKSVLHGIELNMKHQSTSFGLNLLFGLTPLWNHDGDLLKSLQINRLVNKLKSEMEANPRYLQGKVREHFIQNKHRLVLTMSPDEKYEAKQAEAEKRILAEKVSRLTEEDKEEIFEQGLTLMEEQSKAEDTGCLPTLRIADLKEDIERTEVEDVKLSSVPVQIVVQPTNGVTYFRGIVNTSTISEELKSLLPLFAQAVAKMGTKNQDYRQFDQSIRLKTGGLGLSTHIAEDLKDMNRFEEGLMFYTYCLDRNVKDMYGLWTEMFRNVTLNDLKRFDTLVQVIAGELGNGVADMGHHYAMSCAAALVNPAAQLKETHGGLAYIAKMKRLSQLTDREPVLHQMQEISQLVLSKESMRCSINVSPESRGEVVKESEQFVKNLPGKVDDPFVLSAAGSMPNVRSVHHVLPIPVNFAAKAISTVPYDHPDHASLRVLSRLVTSKYLHPNVREKGGAYGSGLSLSAAGMLNFYSYRDPNTSVTFDTFDEAGTWIEKNLFTDQDVEEAKLGVFQSVDAPVPPGSRGMVRFLYGMSDDLRQSHRVALKEVSREDVVGAAEKYLGGVNCGRALIGPENKDLLAREDENWEVVVQE